MSNCNAKPWCALAVVASFAVAALAAESPPADLVVAQNSTVRVTRSEFEAEILRIPPEMRTEFLMSNKRVGDLLTQMLLRKALANQARSEKLDAKPINAARVNNEVERVLAQLRVAQVEEAADAAFEAKRAAQLARAREMYVVDRDRYRTPEEISASHILFDIKKHSSEEARKLAVDARARILAGADFNALAKELSDDPTARQNAGSLGWFRADRMDAAFTRAAFALKTTGDISEPVQSAFGWHIIRLDERRPSRMKSFEEVQEEILSTLKKSYIDQQRDAVVNAIRGDPETEINDAEVKQLVDQVTAPPSGTHPATSTSAPSTNAVK